MARPKAAHIDQAIDALHRALDTMQGHDARGRLGVLFELGCARRSIEAAERLTVAQLREEGATWEQIGSELGVSKQAAQQRYGSP